VLSLILQAFFAASLSAQSSAETGKLRQEPAAPRNSEATRAETIKIVKDFRVERLYSVPKDKEGSWVAMCVDPKGRLIVSDQGGGLFRVTPPPLDQKPGRSSDALKTEADPQTRVEPIAVDIGEAQGLLWAFDSLYVMVNGKEYQNGLYRVRDTDGDGELDDVTQLRALRGKTGEHGPHAILLAPDGQSLVVLHGNQTPLTEFNRTRVPPFWGEDHLLPRMPDGRGFMAGVLGPGGAIYKTDPEGKSWELLSVGFRNEYDAAFNRRGDLFTFDADMEWDFNTPWYRPTRVCMAASGSEFGWRNGTGKWPPHYADSLPAILDIGPGSPTGVTFGYGAKFPAKYQESLFICDWSYGKLYAVHLTPQQSAYTAVPEEFLSGTPLPLTDIVINPADGAMYFAIGGRSTQSGLYRVTYVGAESTEPAASPGAGNSDWQLRQRLEAFHGHTDPKAIEAAWPHLNHSDRYVRYAARVAIEHQSPDLWRDQALRETRSLASIQALLSLVRVSAADPFHRKPESSPADPILRGQIVEALDRIAWSKLDDEQRLELLRVYHVLFNRFGKPDEKERQHVIANLGGHFPSSNRSVNADLCQVLVYLEAPNVAACTLQLLEAAPTQEEQIEYVKALRMLKSGWTHELREEYFSWFQRAGGYKGGRSFDAFVKNIKKEAEAALTDEDREKLQEILEAESTETPTLVSRPRPFVRKWTLGELVPMVESKLKGRDFDRGRSMFGAANCFACHRFNNEGGAAGPDLTALSGRFGVRDLLESIVDPSKVISDQYQSVVIATTDGKVTTGRIVNLHGDTYHINTDMLNPSALVDINRRRIESMEPSKVSMMPTALLDTLNEDEILDLMAFLLSRGDRKHATFR